MEIEKAILEALYEAWHAGQDQPTELAALGERSGWDHRTFTSVCDRLERQGILQELGMSSELTAKGVLEAERRGVARAELCEQNKDARTALCSALAQHAREGSAPIEDLHYQELARACQVDEAVALTNLELLEETGYVEWTEVGCASLTERGFLALEEAERRAGVVDEFQRVSEMEPHERGRAFQSLFARLLEQSGWSQLESVRTSNEEMDVIVFLQREYYLVECKWEKEPVQTEAVRDLFVRLTNRADIRGILASMSGFTAGAIKQAQDRAHERVILFFGPEDLKALFNTAQRFDDLLDRKYREMVVMRRVVFD